MTSLFNKVVIPEEFSRGSVVSEENNLGKNRFPTTTFGNDGYSSLVVIPEEFSRGSVVAVVFFK